jgi:O-antigen/teichoic acid export membrane protein
MTLYQSGNIGGPEDQMVRPLRWNTVYSSAAAARPGNRIRRVVRRDGDLLTNSGSLMGSTIITAATGFVYWWVAARAFSSAAVGSASAAVSAMSLIGTLGMFGMGTMLIAELPRMKQDRWTLISTCLVTAGTVAAVGGLIYVTLAEFVITSLRSSLGSPLMMALLVLGITLNAMVLVLDEALIGLLSGPLQLMRNLYFAVGKLILLCLVGLLPLAVPGAGILATWLGGIVISIGLLWHTLRRRRLLGPLRPRLSMMRGRARHAAEHNVLNMALFLPRTTLPLVVTAVLSTQATAAFYTAWMVFTFAAMIPSNLATTLFAVSTGDRGALRAKVRTALAVSLGLGVPVTAVMAVAAHQIMAIFGAEYAASASGALRILALIYIPTVFRQLFVGVARVLGQVRRAGVLAVVAGVAEMAAGWYGGTQGSLTSMALWLAGVFVVEGLVMGPTVLWVAFAKPQHRTVVPVQRASGPMSHRRPLSAAQPPAEPLARSSARR